MLDLAFFYLGHSELPYAEKAVNFQPPDYGKKKRAESIPAHPCRSNNRSFLLVLSKRDPHLQSSMKSGPGPYDVVHRELRSISSRPRVCPPPRRWPVECKPGHEHWARQVWVHLGDAHFSQNQCRPFILHPIAPKWFEWAGKASNYGTLAMDVT